MAEQCGRNADLSDRYERAGSGGAGTKPSPFIDVYDIVDEADLVDGSRLLSLRGHTFWHTPHLLRQFWQPPKVCK